MMDISLNENNFFVITGGPGAGKTTLIYALEKAGFPCVAEVARQVIQEQLQCGGDGLPWMNVPRYTSLMLDRSQHTYRQATANKPGITFFDRGIPDSIAYARIAGIAISPELDAAARYFRYNNPVFMLPPWPEIYLQDEERRESYEHSVITYEMLKCVFNDYDYKLVEVPKVTVEKRVDILVSTVTSRG